MATEPLTPEAPLSEEAISTSPLEEVEAYPLLKAALPPSLVPLLVEPAPSCNCPPVSAIPEDIATCELQIETPPPLIADPASMVKPVAHVPAAPDPSTTDPDGPAEAKPEPTAKLPESCMASAELTTARPLELWPCPLTSEMLPPDLDVPAPLLTQTHPPLDLLPPATTHTAPPTFEIDLPDTRVTQLNESDTPEATCKAPARSASPEFIKNEPDRPVPHEPLPIDTSPLAPAADTADEEPIDTDPLPPPLADPAPLITFTLPPASDAEP
jgi:hypothetical protein